MAAKPNVQLAKLAISIVSVAAIAGITGRIAGNKAPAGPVEGPVAGEVSAAGQPVSVPYRDEDAWHDWDDDDWDDDWDDDDDDDRGGEDDGQRGRLWGGFTAEGQQAGVRPQRTRTRHS